MNLFVSTIKILSFSAGALWQEPPSLCVPGGLESLDQPSYHQGGKQGVDSRGASSSTCGGGARTETGEGSETAPSAVAGE
jgi:hypothetical protein